MVKGATDLLNTTDRELKSLRLRGVRAEDIRRVLTEAYL